MPSGALFRGVRLVDPAGPNYASYAYISTVAANGPPIAYTAANGYVHYVPDPNRDLMVASQSSYSKTTSCVFGV